MDTTIFETSSRKLEQFLFCHEIRHDGFYKNEDNMTVWMYKKTPEVMEVVKEFRAIQERKNQRRIAS